MKNKEKSAVEMAVMSTEMMRNCKNEIAKFGFEGYQYEKFLVSVAAMKEGGIVLEYPVAELPMYREQFLKERESSLGDVFMLDKFKIRSSDLSGHRYETGYFLPKAFWDYVRDAKI